MSELCLYELVDNVWDEFGVSDDHIVPHTVDERGAQFKVHGVGRKKPRHEVIGVTSNAHNTTNYGIFGEKEKGVCTLTKNRMLEKGPWSHAPDGVFLTSGDNDSLKEATMASDDSRMSGHGLNTGDIDSVGSELCADVPLLVDKCLIEDNNVYHYPLNNMSQTDDDLGFFNNNHEDKENNDLFYGWGDIGNFEDVDRMFRNCDSTFGLGSLSSEDDLYWFSSSQATEGSRDALKADAKPNSVPRHGASSMPGGAGPSTIDSKKKSVFLSDKISSLDMSGDNAGLPHISSLNVSNTESGSKDDLIPNQQIGLHKKQSKQGSISGERKDPHLENGGGSLHHYGQINQFSDMKPSFTGSSCQIFSPGLDQNKPNIEPDSMNYIQTDIPHMNLTFNSSSDQIAMCQTLSNTKSEKNCHSSSTNESSYASNQGQSIESSCGPSSESPVSLMNENRGKLYQRQDIQTRLNRNFKHVKIENQMAFCDQITVQKQANQSEQDEGHSEVEGVSVGKPAELDSSNALESSCVSSVLDEVSLEATSFRQLQQVMEKLDVRTKLCIRDSLYRLARSAEQRHNFVNTKGGVRDDKDASGHLVAEETNKCSGFMDIETDTNPIDRSIAHLLFHRPSDPCLKPSADPVSFKSHGMIHGSIASPPLITEKNIGHEETDAGSDKNLLTSDSR